MISPNQLIPAQTPDYDSKKEPTAGLYLKNFETRRVHLTLFVQNCLEGEAPKSSIKKPSVIFFFRASPIKINPNVKRARANVLRASPRYGCRNQGGGGDCPPQIFADLGEQIMPATRARPDLAYDFLYRTGLNTQICSTSPVRLD